MENALNVDDNQTFYATIDNTITNSDLIFDVNTIINNAISSNTNRTKLNNAIDALNGYFRQPNNSYTISIVPQFSGVNLTPASLSGTVNIVNVPVVTLPSNILNGINTTLRSGQSINETISYTPIDANITCDIPGEYNISCHASNGTINIIGTAPSNGDINTSLDIVQYANNIPIHSVQVPINIHVISIPSNAVELMINNSVDSNSSNDVTLSKNNNADINGNLEVFFVPVNGNPSNSSATIVIKEGNQVIATISPDDRYNGKEFYILYKGELKTVTYNKDAENGEIDVIF